MLTEQDECDQKLEQWLDAFRDAGVRLAALAIVRRGDFSISDACRHMSEYTAGVMCISEPRLSSLLGSLEYEGYVELHDGRYRITDPGKEYMFMLLKQWNRYVDSMNNLWGCYYGT